MSEGVLLLLQFRVQGLGLRGLGSLPPYIPYFNIEIGNLDLLMAD